MLDFFLDELVELLESLSSNEDAAIDEKRGRTIGANGIGNFRIRLDLLLERRVVHVLFELGHIEPDFFGVLIEVFARQGRIVFEALIVHRPAFLLAIGGLYGHGGTHRFIMERQRLMFEYDRDVVPVLLFNLFESRTDPLAERSLEVAKFDDGNFGVLRPLAHIEFGQLDVLRAFGSLGRRLRLLVATLLVVDCGQKFVERFTLLG